MKANLKKKERKLHTFYILLLNLNVKTFKGAFPPHNVIILTVVCCNKTMFCFEFFFVPW